MTTQEMIQEILKYAAVSYWRVGALKELDLTADNYCEVSEPKTNLVIKKEVEMTTQQDKLNIEFPAEVCQELPKAGRKLTYVPVAEVITRLNDVLGTAGWSYTVEERWTDSHESKYGTEVWAMTHVRLVATIDGQQCARDGIGGYNTSKPGMDYADGWKSATSEALKKAAQALGVGLHLSRSEGGHRYGCRPYGRPCRR